MTGRGRGGHEGRGEGKPVDPARHLGYKEQENEGESKHCGQGSEARRPWWQLEGEGVETLSTRGLPPEGGKQRKVVWVIQRGNGKGVVKIIGRWGSRLIRRGSWGESAGGRYQVAMGGHAEEGKATMLKRAWTRTRAVWRYGATWAPRRPRGAWRSGSGEK